MKKSTFRSLIIVLPVAMTFSFASASYAFFDNSVKIDWSAVPAAAQNTVNANINGGKPYEVEKETEDGKDIYKVKAKTASDLKVRLKVDESGKLTGLRYAGSRDEEIAWSKVPDAVQKTITANLYGSKVDKIEKETKAGRYLYEIKAKTSDDHTIKMKVDENGQLQELKTGKSLF